MEWLSETLSFSTNGKGMYEIKENIFREIIKWKIATGMCFLFLPHTSASLTLCESWDPQSRKDVESYYDRAVPENQPWFQHTVEGPDDSPSHIRSTLTQSSISIPVNKGALALGPWQGIFLFEHRTHPQRRKLHVKGLKIN